MRYALTDQLTTYADELKMGQDALEEALRITEEVKSTLVASSWSGQNKAAIISLIDLCEKLHNNVIDANSKTVTAFKKLENDLEEFHSSSEIIKRWRSL